MCVIKICQELLDIYLLSLKENLNNKSTFKLKEKLIQSGMFLKDNKKDQDHIL